MSNKFDHIAQEVYSSAHKVADDVRENVASGGFFRKPVVIGVAVAFVVVAVVAVIVL